MLDSDLEIMKKAAFNKADICNNHLGKYFIRAIVAGFFIVVATMLSNVTAAVLLKTYPQFGKLISSIFFSIARILVVFIGGELFTGNAKAYFDSSSDTQTPAAEESTDTAAEGTDATDASAEKGADPADYKVVMVVKQSDSWFDDMATGIEQLKKDTGLNVSVQVPETGDAASQISIMEDLIAQDVDAICVVPNDPNALVPTIEKARDRIYHC